MYILICTHYYVKDGYTGDVHMLGLICGIHLCEATWKSNISFWPKALSKKKGIHRFIDDALFASKWLRDQDSNLG